MVSTDALTVAQLNNYAKSLLENDPRLRSVRVQGELTGFKKHSSGHLYFSLKDEDALVRCVMFRSSAASVRFVPRDGMKVVLTGSISLYVKDGQYQFYANTMRQLGEGELYLRFLELQKKLGEEGLFDQELKRPIPFLPRCVGIVTSETGAALHDIVTVIRRRFPSMNLLFAPAQVQGETAPETIIDAIRLLNDSGRPDVLIVGRGGGSYEDLSCFNDEALARVIRASRIPVVSAVGHEVDFTIADFAADLRAPTPSAAAELCVPELDALLYDVTSKRERLDDTAKNAVSAARKRIELLKGSAALSKPMTLLEQKRSAAVHRTELLDRSVNAVMAANYARLDTLSEKLSALNPYAVLSRGYAMVHDADSKPIMSAAGVGLGDRISVIFADGTVGATVDFRSPDPKTQKKTPKD